MFEKTKKYILHPYELFYKLAQQGMLDWVPSSIYVRLMFRRFFGRFPDLKHPKTFNEKLQWQKLNDHNPLYTQLVDKYVVREYIKKEIGEEYLIPLLGVWDHFEDIDFNKLPDQFVLKCTHDSGGLVVCKDKKTLDKEKAKKKIESCMCRNYYSLWREWPYKHVKPRIIAEKFMQETDGSDLKDYKFHTFAGVPKILLRVSNRFSNGRFDYFYADSFQPANFCAKTGKVSNYVEDKEPPMYRQMLKLASKLAQPFPYVRVDFYDIDGKIYFGELTFCPGAGFDKFEPEEWDVTFGRWMKIPTD